MRWLGNVWQIEYNRMILKMMMTGAHQRHQGTKGRPWKHWLLDDEDKLWRLGVGRWRVKVRDRENWRILVRKARTLQSWMMMIMIVTSLKSKFYFIRFFETRIKVSKIKSKCTSPKIIKSVCVQVLNYKCESQL